MFGLLNSVVGLGADVVRVAVAPVAVTVNVAHAVVKPVAAAATEVVKEVKNITG
ncbi:MULTISPECIES: hypothetical protein [unclassified Duganella]|uniref:hypothetical protein n=1 Tax=unclassified Duganella TaxID=2636909 RepID=UPI0008839A01|nr:MULTISPECIES: hypothetical protein [unclassified Duganella]SDH05648.1 hypothetical protein SAMN05216320_109133 [Duganella sp. OV458]SDK20483.1 hypothetical protein SAMN05428973_109149 [Duganella sp. OV510]